MNIEKFKIVHCDETSVEEKKKSLREYAKRKRSEEVNRDVKEKLLVENFFTALEKLSWTDKKVFFVYLSFSSEAPTDKLVQTLIEKGKSVYCPRLENGKMELVRYGEDMALSKYGAREPVGQAEEIDPDVSVIPLLAVDEKGNRLGYGKGYYDVFLQGSKSKRIAYCYHSQVVKEVPVEKFDERMEIIVTEREIIKV